MVKIPLTIRIEESEMEILKAFCDTTGRTQTDVLREFIRSLKADLPVIKGKISVKEIEDIDPLQLPSVLFIDKKHLPDCSGVYFVVDQSETVIYIGRAENIKKRWLNHHHFDRCSDCRISWIKATVKASMKVEKILVEKIRPRLNRYPLPKEN